MSSGNPGEKYKKKVNEKIKNGKLNEPQSMLKHWQRGIVVIESASRPEDRGF
jgi:hypothetical protein